MSNPKLRVILADDHAIVRNGIRSMLSGETDIEIVAECNDGSEVIGVLNSRKADVVVSDLNMPRMNGIEMTKLITKQFPGTGVLAFTMHAKKLMVIEMMKAGAKGYILKSSGSPEIIGAIRQVSKGEVHFGKGISEIMLSGYVNGSDDSYSANIDLISLLSKRELVILKSIVEGYTNSEIAEKEFISVRTVDSHRRNILQKLGAKNTADMVRIAVLSGICDDGL